MEAAIIARTINRYCGSSLSPWDVLTLPLDEIASLTAAIDIATQYHG